MNASFGKRLRSARKMAGLSLAGLAERTGNMITRQAINKYEKGMMNPSSEVLLALSRALEIKPDYFFKEPDVSLSNMEFRKKSKLSVKESESIKHRTLDFLERYLEVEDIVQDQAIFANPIPENLRKVTNYDCVEIVADKLRESWNLGIAPLYNLVEIVEDHGIRIFSTETSDHFDGISAWADDIPVIAVNLKHESVRRRFTIAHELGHILLEFEDEQDSKEREKLCHAFAGSFLLPKDVIFSELGSNKRSKIAVLELEKLKEIYGISIQAIMVRIYKLGIVGDSTYRRFWVMVNVWGWKKNEPGVYRGEERANRFKQLVYRAAAEDLITFSKAADFLNKPLSDFRKEFLVAA